MKRTKVFYNVLILLAALLLTACQERKNTPPVISPPEKNLVLSDHISNQKVMSICEDKYGQIWIGTFRGLNKYDGNQYHQYYCVDDSLGLPDNHISHIYRDSHNRLWVATVNGVCLYQANGNFNRVSIKGTNKNIEKIIEDKEGRIFFLTITDIYQYQHSHHQALQNAGEELLSYLLPYRPKRCDVDCYLLLCQGVSHQRPQTYRQKPCTELSHHLFSPRWASALPLWLQWNATLAIPQRHGQLHPSVWCKRQSSAQHHQARIILFQCPEGNHPATKRQEFSIRSA